MNLAPLVRIIRYLTFFIPLFFTYFISRRIEVRLRGRFSRFFWLSVIFMVCSLILCALQFVLPPLAPVVDVVYSLAVTFCSLMGAFFMYLFLLKLREKMGGEDPYDRMTRFVAPMIMPLVLALCMFVPLTYLARLYAGESLSVSWHYTLKDEDRIQVYLTNTLDPAVVKETMPFMQEIKEEIRTANEIKLKKQILAIVGNPPYSVSSSNKSEWILKKMEDYKKDLDEKNIQPLDDDYIKFIRFAQWKIDQNGEGVVGFITNNSYLDGVIHRQMRKSLLESFDQIYVLNLHGSSRKGESIPSDVPKDENVFDIQQGVAISIFVKNNKIKEKKVFYADLFGKREDKYGWLDRNRISTVQWQELKPTEPYYFLVPKDFSLLSEYEKFWKITEIFKEWSSGVKTHRDHFVIGFTKEEIIQRMKTFTSNLPDELVAQTLTLKDTESWKLSIAREKIKKKDWERQIYPYAYRPFDARRICYEPSLVDRDRAEVMKHILINGERNVGLATTRMLANPPFVHAFISNSLPDICLVSTKTKETSYFFPLYLYPDNLQKQLLGQGEDKQQRIPNFTDRFLQAIKEPLSRETEPEEIFYYIYAILYSPTYRKRYEEFLKIDFPRIPMPPDYETFKTISNLGKELVELHLLKHPALQKTEICFPKEGSCKIENVRFNEEEKKVYINKEQCFKGISKEVWEYRIGSYQVLEKYLKDRKDRVLSLDEIAHYMETTKAIKLTIELQNEIDAEYTKMANE